MVAVTESTEENLHVPLFMDTDPNASRRDRERYRGYKRENDSGQYSWRFFVETCVVQDEMLHGARRVDSMDHFQNDIRCSVFYCRPLNSMESISSRNSASESAQSENSVKNCVDSKMVVVTGSTEGKSSRPSLSGHIFLIVSTRHRKISRLEERRS